MAHIPTPWTRLASRAARVVLARKGMTLEAVASQFTKFGLVETVRSVDGKIQRGSYQCAFFLQLLAVCNAEVPSAWRPYLSRERDWFAASRAVYFHELASVTPGGLSAVEGLAAELRGPFDLADLGGELVAGTFPFTRLIELSSVTPSFSLDRFLDLQDVAETYRATNSV